MTPIIEALGPVANISVESQVLLSFYLEDIREFQNFTLFNVFGYDLFVFSVRVQVLYHTPKSSFSYWDGELESYIFSTKHLPFFVCSHSYSSICRRVY